MKQLAARLGPGVIFAAMAVGVSHLVQSTRAGGEYGLSILIFLLLANALKYPLFRFAIVYSAATGKTLLDGYRALGRPATALLIISVLMDMFIAAAAVSYVAAGLVKSVFGLTISTLVVVSGLALIALLINLGSAYRLFERITLLMVFALLLIVLAATLMAIPNLLSAGSSSFPELAFTPALALFVIAMAGWMPNPASASFFLSSWASARHTQSGRGPDGYDGKAAAFDINVGYSVSIAIAVCFAILGTALIFVTDTPLRAGSALEFANTFLGLFTSSFGSWSLWLVGPASILVMFSTMMTIFDGAPRVVRQAAGYDTTNRSAMILIWLLQLAGVLLIIGLFASSFKLFIDVITSLSFATAPFIAYLNYRLMLANEVPTELRPGQAMRVWNWIGIASMILCGGYFLFAQVLA